MVRAWQFVCLRSSDSAHPYRLRVCVRIVLLLGAIALRLARRLSDWLTTTCLTLSVRVLGHEGVATVDVGLRRLWCGRDVEDRGIGKPCGWQHPASLADHANAFIMCRSVVGGNACRCLRAFSRTEDWVTLFEALGRPSLPPAAQPRLRLLRGRGRGRAGILQALLRRHHRRRIRRPAGRGGCHHMGLPQNI